MNKALVAVLGLALAGCVNFGGSPGSPAVVYYVLNDGVAQAPQGALAATPAETRDRTNARTLLVLDTTANAFYDTDALVFSRSADTRGHYQFARWTERPGKRFADLMRARLEAQGAWRVATAGTYVRGDVLLDTALVEFYHDARRAPGQVRLVLRAELVDLKQRTVLARRVFEREVPVASYDAVGAAEASSVAVGRVLDDLAGWLAKLG